MRKHMLFAAACAATVGVALAQVEASSSTYFLDVDNARYAAPAGQRLVLRVGDSPRHVTIGARDELCVQLQRDTANNAVIRARVKALGTNEQVADVRVVAPDISPGTYRSTPWGLLLRAVPEKQQADALTKPVGVEQAPICTL
jgi:hypothetical protein